jgi:molecular chaperone GrpE (heat shock protein)
MEALVYHGPGKRAWEEKPKPIINHDLHEAVGMAEHKDIARGTVVDELRRGYLWKNELLRPAQVRVAG